MIHFEKRLYTAFIFLCTLLFFISFPLFANASSTITISNNGSGSHNSVSINNTNIFTLIQTNFSNIVNTITTNANTGGNKCNGNTKSNCKIKTGSVTTNTDISNTGNVNTVSVPEFSVTQGILTGFLCLGGFFVLRKKALL